MKKIKLLILSIFLLNINFIFVNAAEVKGAADIYKVKMHKLELCTGHTTGDMDDVATSTTQCQDAVTIGSSAAGVEVDIASVDAGAVAGSFGDAMVLPLGETYTHVRVTLNRQMKLRTAAAINTTGGGNVDNCMTIATTDAMYVTDEATDKYTHKLMSIFVSRFISDIHCICGSYCHAIINIATTCGIYSCRSS